MLGIEPEDVTPSKFRALKTGIKQASAARVKNVSKDAPADRAGISVGDIILSVADIPIYSEYDLMRVVGLHAPEKEVEVVLWRHGRPKPFSLTYMPERGEQAYRRAVVVTKVASDSAAHLAGIQPGDFLAEVNRIPVQTPSEFHEATKALKGPVEVRLYEGRKILIGE
jgi:S1-C subfamily serine protease